MTLTILYRGPLSSCNYGCVYCPFAKRKESRQELAHDRANLERFVDWALARRQSPLRVFFTPWGEALIRRWYQEAMVALSQAEHVERVVIQTNLSGDLGFVERCDLDALALWCTHHPEWGDAKKFVRRVLDLHNQGVRLSVGVVGFARFKQDIERLRSALPPEIYLWINAVKRELHTLTQDDRDFFQRIDPLYPINTHHYPSQGKDCHAGQSVISVDGDGMARRCHFIKAPIGNIYEPGFEQALFRRPCTNATCHCHIGYVHMDYLELDKVFGSGILERIPVQVPPALPAMTGPDV